MISAVFFDFNGVLVDDEHLHQAAFNEVLAPHGMSITDEAYKQRYLGFDDRGAFRAVISDHQRPADELLVTDLIARKALVYARMAQHDLRVFSGAKEAILHFACTVPIAIVSGALRNEIVLALGLMSVGSSVELIVAAEDVSACKPDPEGYLFAMRALHAKHPALDLRRSIAIEDSIAGIESARGAGLTVVAVAHTYSREQLDQAGADVVFDTIAELTSQKLTDAISRRSR